MKTIFLNKVEFWFRVEPRSGIEVSNLSVFDYALLGDIHKTNQGIGKVEETIIEIDEEDLQKYIENGWEIVKE